MRQRGTERSKPIGWLGIAPDRKGCGIVLLDGGRKEVFAQTVPWRALAATLRSLPFAPAVVVVGESWRHRWVQAVLRSLFPEALLVLVRRPQPPHPDLSQEALALLRHYLSRENL
ncbi:MAG: hypothetical protein SLRJCFUN_001500 [Candidatus Fervidibacter sp.]